MTGWQVFLMGLVCTAPVCASETAARFALVVAENRPFAGTLEPLRFADDDGVRYAELFEAIGVETELLSVLDAETQARHPFWAARSRAPTKAEVAASMARLNSKMQAARRAGKSTDLYFVFAGHGERGAGGEGRIHLRDGYLTRRDLLSLVVAPSKADFNHLIIDACHASALVFQRGGDGYSKEDFSEAIADYLVEEDLATYPNTGAILAATRNQEAHEWEVFRAGIFSHEVRSGLAGAADVNGDGVVEYSELAAFVAAANRAVRAPGARPEVITRPPALDLHRPIADYFAGARRFLRLPLGVRGRFWLEDPRGERYADLHTSGETQVVVALGGTGPYYLRRGAEEARVSAGGTTDGAGLKWRRRKIEARGALDDAFRRELYGVPFGIGFYEGYVASASGVSAVSHRARLNLPPAADEAETGATTRFGAWPYVAATGALAIAGGALWLGLEAQSDLESFEERLHRDGVEPDGLASRIDANRRWANGLAAASGALAATAAVLFWMNEPVAPVGVALRPGGVTVGGVW